MDRKAAFHLLTTGISFDKKKANNLNGNSLNSTSIRTKDKESTSRKVLFLNDNVPSQELSSLENEDEIEADDTFVLRSDIKKVVSHAKKRKKLSLSEKRNKILLQRTERVNQFRNMNRIHVRGTDISDPIEEWKALVGTCIAPDTLATVIRNYDKPTPVQMQVIPLMLDRRELLVCAPTGSGKTAAYLIPVISWLRQSSQTPHCRCVIVAPTKELVSQIGRECLKLCGSSDLRVVISSNNKGKTLIDKCDILITSPNKLVFMLSGNKILMQSVEWLILDESDKLFECDQDHDRDFRKQLGIIYRACDVINVKRAFFSATLSQDLEKWAFLNLDNVCRVTIGERNTASSSVKQSLVYCGTEKGKLLALQRIFEGGVAPPVLIFVQSRDRATELFSEVKKWRTPIISVDLIHSERSILQREQTVRSFRAGRIWVLICTELMGRGMDFRDVNLVVNYDFPPSTVSYIHRIGRTGRAGSTGKAVTFFTDQDKTLLRSIAHIISSSGGSVPEYMLSLSKPTRQEKRNLASRGKKRRSICYESKYDRNKRLRLEAMIRGSKNRMAKKRANLAQKK